jgi:hypothetical protein
MSKTMVKKDCINSSKEHANRASALFSEQKKKEQPSYPTSNCMPQSK